MKKRTEQAELQTSEPEPNYRLLGLLITLSLGFVLFAFGMVAQLLIYNLRDFAIRSGLEDHAINHWFYGCFALRPTEYLGSSHYLGCWP